MQREGILDPRSGVVSLHFGLVPEAKLMRIAGLKLPDCIHEEVQEMPFVSKGLILG